MTDAPATNELLALADHVRSVALNAADHIGHANYTHRIVEAKQSIREACDKMDDAIRAAATPSAQGAEVSVEELAEQLYQLPKELGGGVSCNRFKLARALLDKYSIRSAMMTEGSST